MQTHPPSPKTSPLSPPRSLLSLPREVMSDVCAQLDQKTAINLLFVHRSLHQPAESRIYRDITLSIPTYWGEPVLIRPDIEYGSDEYVAWAKRRSMRVELAGRAEARRRAEEMIMSLSRGVERWRYVKKLVIEPRVEANNAIVQILSLARKYVTEIEIIKSRDHIYRDQWTPTRGDTFWSKLAGFGSVKQYSFPNLVKVTSSLESWECSCLPELLLIRAPRLEVVKISSDLTYDASSHAEPRSYEDGCDCLHDVDVDPRLDHVRAGYHRTLREATIDCSVDEDNDFPSALILNVILANNLVKLSLTVNDVVDDDGLGTSVIAEIIHHHTLSYLLWNVSERPMPLALGLMAFAYRHGDGQLFALQVLIYASPLFDLSQERLEEVYLPRHEVFVNLKSLGIRTATQATSRASVKAQHATFNDHIGSAQPIPQAQALNILGLQHFDVIQFMPENGSSEFVPVPQWESTGTHGMIITTLKSDDGTELLHIRTYSRAIIQENTDPTSTQASYATSDYPQWEDATYYEGLTVPLSVMFEMKRVHGGSEPLVGRGVDVGKNAWQVLLAWKEENHPDTVFEGVGAAVAEVSRAIEMEDSEED